MKNYYRVVGFLLILAGIGCLFFAWFYLQIPAVVIATTAPITIRSASRQELPAKIDLGDLIHLPVVETQFGSKGWNVAPKAASIASSSARPGEAGNIVIYSHNLRRLFGPLIGAKIGDQVVLTGVSGKIHRYQIEKIDVVSPNNLAYLLPTQTETLTLYTCTGLFDSKRLVVRALPIR